MNCFILMFVKKCADSVLALFAALMLINPGSAIAQYRDLLIPVPEKESAKLREKNEYFLRKNLYFAKNHRIVTINFDALISEAPITIQLFDGEFVNYLPLEVDQSKREVIRWKGIIENPPFSSDELVDQSTSEEDADRVFEAIFGVQFDASQAEYVDGLDANFWVWEGQSTLGDNLFYGISGAFWLYEPERQYFLKLLDMGGPYHLFYEVDESKRFPAGPLYEFWNWSVWKKRRAYKRFIEDLGGDPKNELHRIRQQALRDTLGIDPGVVRGFAYH